MTKPTLSSDRAIRHPREDLLGRAPYANAIAREILSAPKGEGFVVGLLGPWGSGKSSLLNLMARRLEAGGSVVVRFNPWLFSGTEQLIHIFFNELSAQLKLKRDSSLKEIGTSLKQYGDLLSPLKYIPGVGQFAGPLTDAAKAAGRFIAAGEKSIDRERQDMERELVQVDRQIVVLIDDIDRLQPQEVRDIVRLVRLTADFPNCIYVLAFDEKRVERHLDDDPAEGRAYLEKILQTTHAVPPIREADLRRILGEEIDKVLESCATRPVDEVEARNIFYLCGASHFRVAENGGLRAW